MIVATLGRVLRPVVVLGLLSGPLAVVGTGTATAAASATCGGGDYCFYKHFDYNDGYADNKCISYDAPQTDYDVTPDTWFNCSSGATTTDGMDNDLSSLKNRSGTYSVRVFEHDNYAGAESKFTPGQWDGNLTVNTIGDNRMSSYASCIC